VFFLWDAYGACFQEKILPQRTQRFFHRGTQSVRFVLLPLRGTERTCGVGAANPSGKPSNAFAQQTPLCPLKGRFLKSFLSKSICVPLWKNLCVLCGKKSAPSVFVCRRHTDIRRAFSALRRKSFRSHATVCIFVPEQATTILQKKKLKSLSPNNRQYPVEQTYFLILWEVHPNPVVKNRPKPLGKSIYYENHILSTSALTKY